MTGRPAGRSGQVTTPVFCLSEVEIFQDLSAEEMADLAARAPMRTVAAKTVVWSPHQPHRVLFIVKAGQVRLYRVSPEGRRLTVAVLGPGSLFGEMDLVGQRMGEGFAEAVEPTVLCLMSEQDVRCLLLADPGERPCKRASEGVLLAIEVPVATSVLAVRSTLDRAHGAPSAPMCRQVLGPPISVRVPTDGRAGTPHRSASGGPQMGRSAGGVPPGRPEGRSPADASGTRWRRGRRGRWRCRSPTTGGRRLEAVHEVPCRSPSSVSGEVLGARGCVDELDETGHPHHDGVGEGVGEGLALGVPKRSEGADADRVNQQVDGVRQ